MCVPGVERYDHDMRLIVGSDDTGEAPEALIAYLRERGHDVRVVGPLAGQPMRWADVAHTVAETVARGEADQGVLFCWTGTGVSIAANKVPGIRAALCADAETARGARRWNDANVLCLSLRTTNPALAREIAEAWLTEQDIDPEERPQIERIERLHQP